MDTYKVIVIKQYFYIAAIGLLRLHNALSRQHAATKAATLSISFAIVGFILLSLSTNLDSGWVIRLLLLQMTLLITLPLASHALGRSAVIESESDKKHYLEDVVDR